MATPQEKLAGSLHELDALQREGIVAIRSSALSRTHRERLIKNGFLQAVMKGWFIPSRPDTQTGESTAWYACFWEFCAGYLEDRFGGNWCLSPEQSLFLHVGNRSVPKQLLVRAPKGRNKTTSLPHETSMFELRANLPKPECLEVMTALRICTLPAALVYSSAALFRDSPIEARAALAMVADASDVLSVLLDGGHTTIAGRLAGAFRNIGRARIADQIVRTMKSADYDVRENDPFAQPAPLVLSNRTPSPHVTRLRLMWQSMRSEIVERFPRASDKPIQVDDYLAEIDELYATDAHHSLSIEGYRVTPDLIDRVRHGDWDPDDIEEDREQRSALAARGYYDAFQTVKESIVRVLRGEDPGHVALDEHANWYQQLFAPSVTAGIIRAHDLAGYRTGPVFIRNSLHAPPSYEAVRELMPLLFELLSEDNEPAVRVVLGHFVFVYIHPYVDGNGRMGRFLMNVMLAGGGFPWTVIPVERRNDYMLSLESASVGGDIVPFADFLGELVEARLNDRGSKGNRGTVYLFPIRDI